MSSPSNSQLALPPTPNGQNPYLKGGIDTSDILRAKLDPDFFEGYCIGTIHKRLHEATSTHRNDPNKRLVKYQAVLYYVKQLLAIQDSYLDYPDRPTRLERRPTNPVGVSLEPSARGAGNQMSRV